jgi:hypothetical protein
MFFVLRLLLGEFSNPDLDYRFCGLFLPGVSEFVSGVSYYVGTDEQQEVSKFQIEPSY